MQYLIVLIIVGIVVYVISAPLRAAHAPSEPSGVDSVAELEAARDAKYREIRDAELDMRTGKLSDADYEATDGTLRSEAIDILRRLDQAEEPDARESDAQLR